MTAQIVTERYLAKAAIMRDCPISEDVGRMDGLRATSKNFKIRFCTCNAVNSETKHFTANDNRRLYDVKFIALKKVVLVTTP